MGVANSNGIEISDRVTRALKEVSTLLRGPASDVLEGEQLSPVQRELYRI
jgi:hypothetical protein